SAHSRQLPLLARAQLRRGPAAAELRQAAPPGLSRCGAPGRQMEWQRSTAAASRRGRALNERKIPIDIRDDHRSADRIGRRSLNFAREGFPFILIAALVAAG